MDDTKKLDELEAFEAEIASLEGKDGRWTAADGTDSGDAAPPPSNVVVSLSKRPVLDKQPAGPLPKSVRPKKPKVNKTKQAAKIKAMASKISSSLKGSSTLKKAKISASSTSNTSTTTIGTPTNIISASPTTNPQTYTSNISSITTSPFSSTSLNPHTVPHQTPTPTQPIATKPKKVSQKNLRAAAGRVWEDKTLDDWPENDFRIFCGDLGNEVNDNTLAKAFVRYGSFAKAKVVRDKRTQKTKGFGFVSFLDPFDCARALKEMNGKYIGNRPVKLRKSVWDRRAYTPSKKKRKKGKAKEVAEETQEGSPEPELNI